MATNKSRCACRAASSARATAESTSWAVGRHLDLDDLFAASLHQPHLGHHAEDVADLVWQILDQSLCIGYAACNTPMVRQVDIRAARFPETVSTTSSSSMNAISAEF